VEVPRPAALLRDFVNSVDLQDGIEQLTDPAAARRWLLAHDLLDPDAAITAADLRRLLTVREGLRALWRGDGPASLNRALAGVRLHPEFAADGGLALVAEDGADRVTARLLDAVLAGRAGGFEDRLKVCARDSCRWAFFDTSRNRAGRWCSMAECGNKVKMRRAYARRRP
jgi:predicted RNA-binding Zn ribbon-like protein